MIKELKKEIASLLGNTNTVKTRLAFIMGNFGKTC
jgi:hypothetical protein